MGDRLITEVCIYLGCILELPPSSERGRLQIKCNYQQAYQGLGIVSEEPVLSGLRVITRSSTCELLPKTANRNEGPAQQNIPTTAGATQRGVEAGKGRSKGCLQTSRTDAARPVRF